ncbi:MAG: EamA family transporter [Leptothrix sp. (in: Bacteria)]|nr:EamA family transporter [Leptothrix sp. (in: b-proteobacteria)]
MHRQALIAGTLYALAAGLLWGVVFIAPTLLHDYPAVLQTMGRYLAFGLIALPLAVWDRARLAELTRADWVEAAKLAAVGNVLYYLCLSAAIQRAGVPLPTMIIGTLPVVIAVTANLRGSARGALVEGRLPWRHLLPSLALIAAGLACVNQAETAQLPADTDLSRYTMGALLAVAAAACWTWYPIRNGEWLRAHAGRSPRAWATAQGLATLPMAAAGYLAFWLWAGPGGGAPAFEMPFGPQPLKFIALMLAVGLLASWLGTLCWNEASQRLPPALAGQLIVFETLAALAYAFVLRWQWPGWLTGAGVALLIAGVVTALRVRPRPPGAGVPEGTECGPLPSNRTPP